MRYLVFLLFVAVLAIGCGENKNGETSPRQSKSQMISSDQESSRNPNIAIDPICGTEVLKSRARFTAVYDGKTYYFCDAPHQLDFVKDPQRYLADKTESSVPSEDGRD